MLRSEAHWGMSADIKGLQTHRIHLLKFGLCEKMLFFDRFPTFNSLTPMSEELLSPEIIGETSLCYYLSRDFVQKISASL